MNPQSTSTSCDFSQILLVSPPICPCKRFSVSPLLNFSGRKKLFITHKRKRYIIRACMIPSDGGNHKLNIDFANSTARGAKSFVVKRFSSELEERDLSQDSVPGTSNFTNYGEDPIVDKLRTQLGVIHPIPSPPINRNIVGLFVFFFFVGVVFDKVWTSRKRNKSSNEGRPGIWPQVPTSFSLFLEKDLQRKESVEWVNMVLGKLWKVYKPGLENWLTGLLQPVIDNLKKPDYVQRVEIKQFSLGDEPLSVRNVERRTSRRVNDLQ